MKIIMFAFLTSLLSLMLLSGCQSLPPTEVEDSEVCIGEPVVVDGLDNPVDLEEMAKQVDCH